MKKTTACIIVMLLTIPLSYCHNHTGSELLHTPLANSLILDPGGHFHVSWSFNKTDITFEIRVKTLGYVALGFSSNGGMSGSDIVMAWFDGAGNPVISDRYADSESEPLIDENQDYILLAGFQNNSHTTIRFSRPLELCDSQDMQIGTNTIRLIWAYSESGPDVNGRLPYHNINRGAKSVLLLNPTQGNINIPANSTTFDILQNVTLPSDKTIYWCRTFALPKFHNKHHVIKIEPLIQAGNEALVHHTLLFTCHHEINNSRIGLNHACEHPNMPDRTKHCWGLLTGWAIGGGPFYFPDHVGIALGTDKDPTMLLLETHYDNPSMRPGVKDTSGIRLTLTSDLRQFDATSAMFGTSISWTELVPPQMPNFRVDGWCDQMCLSQAMGPNIETLTIFAGLMHTHLIGRRVRLRHFRNGVEQNLVVDDKNFDFNFQETRLLKREITIRKAMENYQGHCDTAGTWSDVAHGIFMSSSYFGVESDFLALVFGYVKRGDELLTQCYFNSMERENVTEFGDPTSSEMCLVFLFFYPKISLGICASSPHIPYLARFAGIEINPLLYQKDPILFEGTEIKRTILGAINMSDPATRERWQEARIRTGKPGFFRVCAGDTFYPSHGRAFSYPKVTYELPEVKCGGSSPTMTTEKTSSGQSIYKSLHCLLFPCYISFVLDVCLYNLHMWFVP